MAWQKVHFVQGWTSMNVYYTKRLTYIVKQLLKKGFAHSSQKKLKKNLKFDTKTVCCVHDVQYVISKRVKRIQLEKHNRYLDYLDVIFEDYRGWFHHVCIEGLDINKSNQNHVIVYDSDTSDDDL